MAFKLNSFQKLVKRDFKKQTLKMFGNDIKIIREGDRKEIILKCIINELSRKEVKKNYDIFITNFENLSLNYIEISFDVDNWQEKFNSLPVVKEQYIINNRLFSVVNVLNNNYTFFTVLLESIEV